MRRALLAPGRRLAQQLLSCTTSVCKGDQQHPFIGTSTSSMQRLARGGAAAPTSAAAAAAAASAPPRRHALLPLPPAHRRSAAAPTLARASHSQGGAAAGDDDDREPPDHPLVRLSPPAPRPLSFRKWPAARRARAADPVAHHPGLRASLRTRGEVEVVLELPPAAAADGLLGGGVGGGAAGAGSEKSGSGAKKKSDSSSPPFPRPRAERLAEQLGEDAGAVLELAVRERAAAAARRGERYVPPQVALASVVLTDDARMRELNFEHRGKDAPTDVLTLELRDPEVDRGRVRLPVRLLGDAIISLDTAARQAKERREMERRRRRRELEGAAAAASAASAGGGKRRRRTEGGGGGVKGFGGGGAGAAKAPARGAQAPDDGDGDDYTLLDELRVLLVHGALHLVGLDHEASEQQHEAMAAAERRVMAALGWRGSGLISAAEAEAEAMLLEEEEEEEGLAAAEAGTKKKEGSNDNGGGGGSSSDGDTDNRGGGQGPPPAPPPAAKAAAPSSPSSSSSSATTTTNNNKKPLFSTRPRLVALDMDGTLLNGESRIDAESARVIRAAAEERGVRVVLATGKARPAALSAARQAGLEGLLCSEQGPGVFLQGLAVHGARGEALSDAALPPALVRGALLWAEREGVPLCCFLGDECATLRLTPELEQLHTRYYEPLSVEHASADSLLERAALVGGTRKLLFMSSAEAVRTKVEPYWRRELRGGGGSSAASAAGAAAAAAAASAGGKRAKGAAAPAAAGAGIGAGPFAGLADVTIAVPEMLEVVPAGVNKWVGLQTLLRHLDVSPQDLMAVGDGANDLEMVAGAGVGVAMGNAVGAVKAAAAAVVARHDEGGIVEAFERFVL